MDAEIYVEPDEYKYVILKIRQKTLIESYAKNPREYVYLATRSAWKIKPKDIREYPYVLSVTNGVVNEVYRIVEWIKVGERFEFNGKKAEKGIRDNFVGKKIPAIYRKRGLASPVLYSKN